MFDGLREISAFLVYLLIVVDKDLGNFRPGELRRGSLSGAQHLAHAVVDLSGRPMATISIDPDPGMAAHALESFVQQAKITLHVTATGTNAHHVAEASFKAVGRALSEALQRESGVIKSTKGSL